MDREKFVVKRGNCNSTISPKGKALELASVSGVVPTIRPILIFWLRYPPRCQVGFADSEVTRMAQMWLLSNTGMTISGIGT